MARSRKSNHFINLNLNVRGLNQSATLLIKRAQQRADQTGKNGLQTGPGTIPGSGNCSGSASPKCASKRLFAGERAFTFA